mgnify:CR=1 FL=1
MTVAHINALELLGKQVSFVYKQDEHSFDCEGLITDVVFSISGESQISLNDGDFYCLSDLQRLEIVN